MEGLTRETISLLTRPRDLTHSSIIYKPSMFELPFFSHPPPPPPPPPPPTNPLSTMFATSTLGLAVLFILRSRKQRAEITHLTKDLNRLFVDKEKAEMALMQTELNLQKTFVEKEREIASPCTRILSNRRRSTTSYSPAPKPGSASARITADITELAQLGPEWKLEEEPEPVLFLKPTSSYAWPGQPLVIPRRRPAVLGGGITPNHGVHHGELNRHHWSNCKGYHRRCVCDGMCCWLCAWSGYDRTRRADDRQE